jgi:hypothetical protein
MSTFMEKLARGNELVYLSLHGETFEIREAAQDELEILMEELG